MGKIIFSENIDVNDNYGDNWKTTTLSKNVKDYNPYNILNADETALLFMSLPPKILTFKNGCLGWKQRKKIKCKYEWTSEIETTGNNKK